MSGALLILGGLVLALGRRRDASAESAAVAAVWIAVGLGIVAGGCSPEPEPTVTERVRPCVILADGVVKGTCADCDLVRCERIGDGAGRWCDPQARESGQAWVDLGKAERAWVQAGAEHNAPPTRDHPRPDVLRP